jgi:hypothetical protein
MPLPSEAADGQSPLRQTTGRIFARAEAGSEIPKRLLDGERDGAT